MSNKYYIHQTEHWSAQDLNEIKTKLNTNYKQSVEAAIGEGASGTGFDTVVELLLVNPVTTGVLSAAIYDVAKTLWRHRPSHRPKTPEGISSRYRLVVHTSTGLIGINLDGDIAEIKKALDQIPDLPKEGASRAYQSSKGWNLF